MHSSFPCFVSRFSRFSDSILWYVHDKVHVVLHAVSRGGFFYFPEAIDLWAASPVLLAPGGYFSGQEQMGHHSLCIPQSYSDDVGLGFPNITGSYSTS